MQLIRWHRSAFVLAASAALGSAPTADAAELYKSVSQDGKTTYSDSPMGPGSARLDSPGVTRPHDQIKIGQGEKTVRVRNAKAAYEKALQALREARRRPVGGEVNGSPKNEPGTVGDPGLAALISEVVRTRRELDEASRGG